MKTVEGYKKDFDRLTKESREKDEQINAERKQTVKFKSEKDEVESQLGKVRSEMEQMKVQHRDSTSVSKAEQEKIAKAEADLA